MTRSCFPMLAIGLAIPLSTLAAEPEVKPGPGGQNIVRLTRDNLQSLHFSPDGSVQIRLPGNGTAEFRRSESGALIHEATLIREVWQQGQLLVHADCSDAVFSPDGRAVLLYNSLGVMAVHDTRTGRSLSQMTINDPRVQVLLGISKAELTLTDDLSRIALCQPGFGGGNGEPAGLGWVFDVRSGNRLQEIPGLIAVVALKGGVLWGAVQDPFQKKLQLWDLRKDAKIRDIEGNLDWVIDQGVFSRDGQHLACTAATKRIAVWNVQSGRNELVAPLGEKEIDPGHPGVALSDEGRYLVTMMLDREKGFKTQIRVWDVRSGAQQWSASFERTLPKDGPILLPDGKRFAATLRKENLIRIWDLRTGIEE